MVTERTTVANQVECGGGSGTYGSLESSANGEEPMQVDDDGQKTGQLERLIISASVMELLCNNAVSSTTGKPTMIRAMIDSGANVNLAPVSLARTLGLHVTPHTDDRKIGTADSDGSMIIKGWIHPRGYTGPIALVEVAAFTLIACSNRVAAAWYGSCVSTV